MSDTNPDNKDEPRQAAADRDESRLTATDHGVSRPTAVDRDLAQYTMTIDEALTLFKNAGLERNKRTIERYCEHSQIAAVKIVAAFGPTWYLNAESVEGKIKNLLQFEEQKKQRATVAPTAVIDEVRHDDSTHSVSEVTATSPDTPRQEEQVNAPLSQPVVLIPEVAVFEEENKRLRQENLDLKIDNRGLTKTVNILVEESREISRERKQMANERMTWMAQIGEMTSRLLQLSPGRETRTPPPRVQAEVIHESERPPEPRSVPPVEKPQVDNWDSERPGQSVQ